MSREFGIVSRAERRQAALFLDDLGGAGAGPRRPMELAEKEPPHPRMPPRKDKALSGEAFMETIRGTGRPASWVEREEAIVAQLLDGNMPGWLRHWEKVWVHRNGKRPRVMVRVLPDYLCVGSDKNYRHVPLDQQSAQKIADEFQMLLPTAKVCHAIWRRTPDERTIGAIEHDYWRHDAGRVAPRGWVQTSTAAYNKHSLDIQNRMSALGATAGQLVCGHKKDVVLSPALHGNPAPIAFHGFYSGRYPYEPCYDRVKLEFKPGCNRELPSLAHSAERGRFADYSQGVRLMDPYMWIDGVRHLVEDVLQDKDLSKLISAEGPIVPPRIPKPPK